MRLLKGVICILLLIVSACSNNDSPIRIGVNDWPPCEIWYIAKEKNFFNGTKVEIIRFSTWTDNMESLYLGKTDITHSTYFNSLYYKDKGESAKIILSSDTIRGGDGLVIKKDISDIAALKGKKIAVEIYTDEHFLLYKALKNHNVNMEDVVLENLPSNEGKNQFINNKVDAVFTYEPFLSEAADKGNGKIVYTTKDMPGYMIDVLVAKSDIIKDRKSDLKNIITGWYKAQDYIKNNRNDSFAVMAKNEKMDNNSFAAFYDSFYFFSLDENKKMFSSNQFKSIISEMAAFLHKNINSSEIFTTEVLP